MHAIANILQQLPGQLTLVKADEARVGYLLREALWLDDNRADDSVTGDRGTGVN